MLKLLSLSSLFDIILMVLVVLLIYLSNEHQLINIDKDRGLIIILYYQVINIKADNFEKDLNIFQYKMASKS